MATDNFQAHDYYLMDELLSDEHKLIRETARAWVKKEVTPTVEDFAQKAEFPKHWIKGLAEIGAFGPYIPTEYGGPGLDQISYGRPTIRLAGIFMAFMTNAKLQVFALIGYAYFGSLDVAVATEIAGRASVIDADTIEIHGQRIRLLGVDAP